jgi:2-C-methyl-D-erythritol 4-phosphate cytidylyltransferase
MTPARTFALIPAAGMGKRMGASINKQYLKLGGMPILARTLAVFEQSPLISGICLVIPADEIPYCREQVVEAHGFRKVMAIVAGGAERQYSVMNGLTYLAREEQAAGDDVVLIHDGVRPLITAELLQKSIDAARSGDGALVAVPAKDTIKIVQNGLVVETPARETLWQAQTPQTFRFDLIYQAHCRAEQDGFTGTDDASLIERLGGRVRIVPGDYRNIKITTPEDLILAEAFLTAHQSPGV